MRVVDLVAIVGDKVAAPGGDGTLIAWPPLGAPNGYRFELLLPVLAVVLGEFVVLGDVVVVAFDAPEAENTPPTPSAIHTRASAATKPSPATVRDVLNIDVLLPWFAGTAPELAPGVVDARLLSGRPSQGCVRPRRRPLRQRQNFTFG